MQVVTFDPSSRLLQKREERGRGAGERGWDPGPLLQQLDSWGTVSRGLQHQQKKKKNYKREQLINLATYREMMRFERERERETEENKERAKRKSDGKKLWVQKQLVWQGESYAG